VGFYSLGQLATAVVAHWKTVALATLAALSLALLYLSLTPKSYVSTTSVIFHTQGSDPVSNKSDVLSFATYMVSETELMTSQRVLARLANDPAFAQNKSVIATWKKATNGKQPLAKWLRQTLPGMVKAKTGKQSRVVDLRVEARDPKFAAAVANGLAQAYLDTNLELRVSPARQNAKWFERQKQVRFDALGGAQAKVSAFLRKTGMTGLEIKSDIDDVQLRTLSSELSQVQAKRASVDSQQQNVNTSSALGIGLINNPTAQQLRTAIADQKVIIENLSGELGPNHPRLQAAEQKLSSLQAEFESEINMVSRDLGSRRRSVQSEEAKIRRLTDQQRNTISTSSANRAQLGVLLDDVERARSAYAQVSTRLSEIELASALEKPNASVLFEATAPNRAAAPNWSFTLIFSMIAGLLSGTLMAIIAELLQPKIRHPADFEHHFPTTPLLCELSR
jgi:polysaccharide biosynthesis transport protein